VDLDVAGESGAFGPHPQPTSHRFAVFFDVEHDALSLTERSEDAAFERFCIEEHLTSIRIGHHDSESCRSIEDLDDTLHSR